MDPEDEKGEQRKYEGLSKGIPFGGNLFRKEIVIGILLTIAFLLISSWLEEMYSRLH